jgi:hypothetical protein
MLMGLSHFEIGLLAFALLAGVGVVAYSAYLLHSVRRQHEATMQRTLDDFFTILRHAPVEPDFAGTTKTARSKLASKQMKDIGH